MAANPPMPSIPPQPGGMRPLPQVAVPGGPVIAPPAPVQPAPADGGATVDENGPNVQLTFWQLPFVQNVLPFLTSFLVHAVVIVVGILLLGQARALFIPPHQEQIAPAEDVSDDGDNSNAFKGLMADASRPPEQNKFDVPDAHGVSQNPTDMSKSFTPDGGGSGDAASGEFAVGPNSNFGAGSGVGSGTGSGNGSGDGGGELAPFGIPGGGGGGGRVQFVGVKMQARRIVFCCDATGSMMSHFDDLRVEINKAVAGLKSQQQFGVVFIQDSNPAPLSKELMPATPANKNKCKDYVDKFTARGTTEPLAPLKQALAMKPEVLFFLIDPSDFPDKAAVLDLLRKANANHTIKIHTIAFIDRDAEDEKFLEQMAKENNGTFTYVSQEDLTKGD